MSLLGRVVGELERAGIPFAVIGASALPALGVSRSTTDLDLMVTDPRCLESTMWGALAEVGVQVNVRPGDALDPLRGVVRFSQQGELDIDLVIGRRLWQARALERATTVPVFDLNLPIVRGEDLILLKLFAGGPQDLWDIRQILAGAQRAELVAAVEKDLKDLPAAAQRAWSELVE